MFNCVKLLFFVYCIFSTNVRIRDQQTKRAKIMFAQREQNLRESVLDSRIQDRLLTDGTLADVINDGLVVIV